MNSNVINRVKNQVLTQPFNKDQSVLVALFSALFLLYFIFREFLFYVAPFMPSTGVNMVYLELVGTFSVFGLEIVIPFLLYVISIPLSRVYLAVTLLMLWGGTILSFLYPTYYMTVPWVMGSLVYAALTMLSLLVSLYELRAKSAPLIPLILLQLLSLILYVANVLTEYFAAPLGGLSPYFVYPMLYLAGAGGIALLIYSIYSLIMVASSRGINVKLILGQILALVMGVALAYPLYELTAYNSFMSHIMSMVFAMGLGILAPPASMPLIAVFVGIYVYSIITLIINGAINHSPMQYLTAIAALIYVTTAFIEHAIIVVFASVLAVTNLLIYLGIISRSQSMGGLNARVP